MTPSQYEAALARTRLKDKTRAATRLVLVEGLTNAEAGRRVGISKEAVRQAVLRIEIAHKGIVGCPPDWHCVTVCLPGGEVHSEVLEIERRAWREAGLLAD